MKRKISSREIVLLVFLVVIIVALAYYKFLYEPLQLNIQSLQSQRDSEQTMVDQYSVTSAQMDEMQSVVDLVKGSEQSNPIPVFNNSTALMDELYTILSMAESYSLNFGTVTRPNESYIVDRPVEMSFETKTYVEARAILDSIEECPYVNQISNLNIVFPLFYDGGVVWNLFNNEDQSLDEWDPVSVNLTVTFYEVVEE